MADESFVVLLIACYAVLIFFGIMTCKTIKRRSLKKPMNDTGSQMMEKSLTLSYGPGEELGYSIKKNHIETRPSDSTEAHLVHGSCKITCNASLGVQDKPPPYSTPVESAMHI